jgi:hypothetical protein
VVWSKREAIFDEPNDGKHRLCKRPQLHSLDVQSEFLAESFNPPLDYDGTCE